MAKQNGYRAGKQFENGHEPNMSTMILDGIENCVRYGHNFDHEKYDNPFAYFSQMVYYAFVRRIKAEKKEAAKKGRHRAVKLGFLKAVVDRYAIARNSLYFSKMPTHLRDYTRVFHPSVT